MNHFCIVSRDDVSMNFLTPTFLTTIFNMFLPVSINLFWERSNIVMVGNKIQKSEKLMSQNVHNCSWIMIWRCPFSSISSRIFQKNLCENYMLWKPNWPHLRCFLWKVFWPFTKKRTIHVPRGCWKSFSKAGFEAICSNQCQINPSVLNSLKTQNYKERIPAN